MLVATDRNICTWMRMYVYPVVAHHGVFFTAKTKTARSRSRSYVNMNSSDIDGE